MYSMQHRILLLGITPAYLLQVYTQWPSRCMRATVKYIPGWSRGCAALILWLLGVMLPFYGTINSFMGAIGVPTTSFVLPAIAYNWHFRTREARAAAQSPPPRRAYPALPYPHPKTAQRRSRPRLVMHLQHACTVSSHKQQGSCWVRRKHHVKPASTPCTFPIGSGRHIQHGSNCFWLAGSIRTDIFQEYAPASNTVPSFDRSL